MVNEISTQELRATKPYVLLVNPEGTRAAAYNAQHRLVVEEVSPALLDWGLAHHVHAAAWDDRADANRPRQRPGWVPTASLAGWRLLWLRDGSTPLVMLLAMPTA